MSPHLYSIPYSALSSSVDSTVFQEPRTGGVTFPSQMSRHSSLRSRERAQNGLTATEPKKSVSMGQIQPAGGERGGRSATRTQDLNGNSGQVIISLFSCTFVQFRNIILFICTILSVMCTNL